MLGACASTLWDAYDLAILDLDGVVYVGRDAVPGAAKHLAAARAAGMRCFAVPSSHPDAIRQLADGVFGSWDEVSEAHVRAALP